MSCRICPSPPGELLAALREGEEEAALEALEQWLEEGLCPTVLCPLRAVEWAADLACLACEAGADPSAVAAAGVEAVRLLLERRPGEGLREPLREAVRQWAALVRAESPLSERIRRAVAHLHAHCTDPDLKEEEVAREALLCPSRFWRAFREERGVTYRQYLRNLRVEEAQRLLASTSLSVGEVAQRVGDESPEAFGRAFKMVVGMSPGQYRQQLKGKAGLP